MPSRVQVRASSERIGPRGFPSTWKEVVAAREAGGPGTLDDGALPLARQHDGVASPVLGVLLRPHQLPDVALDVNVALHGAPQLPLPDPRQVGEPEDVGFHSGTEAGLEVGADGDALVLGDVLT